MDINGFRQSLAAASPPPGASALLQALWHDAKGGWQRAHEIVQAVKGQQSARVHARVPNTMKRAMRCHDFGSGLEESPAA